MDRAAELRATWYEFASSFAFRLEQRFVTPDVTIGFRHYLDIGSAVGEEISLKWL